MHRADIGHVQCARRGRRTGATIQQSGNPESAPMILLNLLAVSIGIGLLVTLLLVEVFGLAAGGLVVPGYFALKLLQPWNMAITLLASYLTFITVRALASFMVVYGRRRTALMILFGYLFGSLIDLSIGGVMRFPVSSEMGVGLAQFRYFELVVIGYINHVLIVLLL